MTDWNVVAKLRIMPEGVETDLEKIKKAVGDIVGQKAKVHSMEVKPIAFGLNALEVNILLNDKQGGFEGMEERIRALKGVGEVETTDINRL
jgi:elongation factor 1-beta